MIKKSKMQVSIERWNGTESKWVDDEDIIDITDIVVRIPDTRDITTATEIYANYNKNVLLFKTPEMLTETDRQFQDILIERARKALNENNFEKADIYLCLTPWSAYYDTLILEDCAKKLKNCITRFETDEANARMKNIRLGKKATTFCRSLPLLLSSINNSDLVEYVLTRINPYNIRMEDWLIVKDDPAKARYQELLCKKDPSRFCM